MDVIVIGGGLGGLALAAGLRRAGIGVTVIERDRDLAATGGYHITLREPAQRALARLVPAAILERILASAADGRRRDPDVMWDPRGRMLGRIPLPNDDLGVDLDRITLRLLLAEAVGDDLRRGEAFTGWERDGARVVARLASGETLSGDLVVGADGVHSIVSRRLAGTATSAPTGVVGISGRTPVAALNPDTAARLGPRSSLGIGPGAVALYLGYLDPVGHAAVDAPELRASVTTEPTYIWGAMFRESAHTRELARLEPDELRAATVSELRRRGWRPAMVDVVERSIAGSSALFRFHAAPGDARRQAVWAAGPVTALGDAVHATPPTAGMGAGTAILDADDLVGRLIDHRDGGMPLTVAVRQFEDGMRHRGAAAIAAAMPTIRQVLATGTPFGALATRAALPVMAGVSRLRGR